MRVVVAVDKFKGTLSAREAAARLAAGLHRGWPDLEVVELPLSDGGEGFLESLVGARGGRMETVTVTGPLGAPVSARLALLADGRTAVVESAEACGLTRVDPADRDPWRTTSRGVGELIRAALDLRPRRLLVGVGGTASNDAGAGLALGLGARLADSRGRPLLPGARGLLDAARVDLSGLDPRLAEVEVIAACDVDNPLYGPRGASCVYAPQKGASPDDIPRLDAAVARFARLVEEALGAAAAARADGAGSLAQRPGAGAGGGLGFGLAAFAGARLTAGSALVLAEVGAAEIFARADLVVTGEGRLDASTLHGKLPAAVARLARQYGVPTVAVCGELALPPEALEAAGFAAAVPLVEGPAAPGEAMADAARLAEAAGRRLAALLQIGYRAAGVRDRE